MKLDNAAKIYPAAMSRKWMAMFRLSATLTQPVDKEVLSRALAVVMKRLPYFSIRLRSGMFWNYFEFIDGAPPVLDDTASPCQPLNLKEQEGFLFRVRVYHRRIALEIFHALTDGHGATVFLHTLVAEYLTLKYKLKIPRGGTVLDCAASPAEEEHEDGFFRFARGVIKSRSESTAYKIPGTPVPDFLFITTGMMDVKVLLAKAHDYDATITEFLTAVLIMAVQKVQSRYVRNKKKHKPVKVSVPINLRNYYQTRTMRNFSSYINPGIEPHLGDYTLEETVKMVKSFMELEMDEKKINAKFSTNVHSERNLFVRIVPLVLKSQLLKFIFKLKGERQSSSTLTNLGRLALPEEMEKYVERLDYILGPLSRNRVACTCSSYKGIFSVTFTRTITEPEVVRNFFTELVKMGIHVKIESNGGVR